MVIDAPGKTVIVKHGDHIHTIQESHPAPKKEPVKTVVKTVVTKAQTATKTVAKPVVVVEKTKPVIVLKPAVVAKPVLVVTKPLSKQSA